MLVSLFINNQNVKNNYKNPLNNLGQIVISQ